MSNKMKVITINDSNIKDVFGRLKKFFYNKNHTGFESWHNFDCGFKKKHINRYITLKDDKEYKCYTGNIYPSPLLVSLGCFHDEYYISIKLDYENILHLDIGDKICFLSNRIIVRTKSFINHKYVYETIQALPMTPEKNKSLEDHSLRMHKLHDSLYENDEYTW